MYCFFDLTYYLYICIVYGQYQWRYSWDFDAKYIKTLYFTIIIFKFSQFFFKVKLDFHLWNVLLCVNKINSSYIYSYSSAIMQANQDNHANDGFLQIETGVTLENKYYNRLEHFNFNMSSLVLIILSTMCATREWACAYL